MGKFFGTWLVKTTENLGSQSASSSHPNLLDWMASVFQTPKGAPGGSAGWAWHCVA